MVVSGSGGLGANAPQNKFAGPHSPFFYGQCPNAYAFPNNDGAEGAQPANHVVTTCGNTDVTLALCPGSTSHIPKLAGDGGRVDEINQRISEAGSELEEPKTAGLDLGSPVERSNSVCS